MEKSKAVANFFIDMATKCDREPMTQLRLQKMLYYAQAWSIVRNGRPLFDDPIEAWKLGPVVPSLYREYSRYGNQPINEIDRDYSPDLFSEEELSLLMDVMREYDQYTTPTLVDRTHRVCEPWGNAYKNPPHIITQEAMRDYFSAMPALKMFDEVISGINELGYRDEEGYLVLPAELDCGGDVDAR